MKKSFIVAGILFSTLSFGFDLKQIASDVAKNIPQNVETTGNNQKSNLDNSTISNGLKEALKNGVTYATSTLGKDNGYLNSDKVKIPLPDNLKNVEGVIRKAGTVKARKTGNFATSDWMEKEKKRVEIGKRRKNL